MAWTHGPRKRLSQMTKKFLLAGCGSARDRRISATGSLEWDGDVVTVDIDATFKPDQVWDLTELPYPWADEEFDEIHLYEVLEHLGAQGDYKAFFAQFEEFYRILKPEGLICATIPWWQSRYAYADPGHSRVFTPDTFLFLDQEHYERGKDLAMTDYRSLYKADFKMVMAERRVTAHSDDNGPRGEEFLFGLQAAKS